jgi:hypothetical protein
MRREEKQRTDGGALTSNLGLRQVVISGFIDSYARAAGYSPYDGAPVRGIVRVYNSAITCTVSGRGPKKPESLFRYSIDNETLSFLFAYHSAAHEWYANCC